MINHMQDVEHGRLTEGIRPAVCPLSREWFGDDLTVRSLGPPPAAAPTGGFAGYGAHSAVSPPSTMVAGGRRNCCVLKRWLPRARPLPPPVSEGRPSLLEWHKSAATWIR